MICSHILNNVNTLKIQYGQFCIKGRFILPKRGWQHEKHDKRILCSLDDADKYLVKSYQTVILIKRKSFFRVLENNYEL